MTCPDCGSPLVPSFSVSPKARADRHCQPCKVRRGVLTRGKGRRREQIMRRAREVRA